MGDDAEEVGSGLEEGVVEDGPTQSAERIEAGGSGGSDGAQIFIPGEMKGETSRVAAYSALAKVVETCGPRPPGRMRAEVQTCLRLIRQMAEQDCALAAPPLIEPPTGDE